MVWLCMICSRSLEITRCQGYFFSIPSLKIAVIFASFQALGTCPESTDDWNMSCIIGVRWEA